PGQPGPLPRPDAALLHPGKGSTAGLVQQRGQRAESTLGAGPTVIGVRPRRRELRTTGQAGRLTQQDQEGHLARELPAARRSVEDQPRAYELHLGAVVMGEPVEGDLAARETREVPSRRGR